MLKCLLTKARRLPTQTGELGYLVFNELIDFIFITDMWEEEEEIQWDRNKREGCCGGDVALHVNEGTLGNG